MIKRILCAIRGHLYVVEKRFTSYSRKVACTRCNRKWAMNDDVRAFLPWSIEFEEFHKNHGAPMKHDTITFTRDEVKKHEKCVEDLRNQVYDLKRVIAHLESRKLPVPDADCEAAFEDWYKFEVGEDMDIHTEIAWGNWQIAWNAAMNFSKFKSMECKVP